MLTERKQMSKTATDSFKNDVILSVRNLKVRFYTRRGIVEALNEISFDVKRKQILGIVGESGSGKSVLALSLLNLIEEPGRILNGTVLFEGRDLLKISEKEMRTLRGGAISMIFPDPMSAFDPTLTVGYQLRETILRHHRNIGKKEAQKVAIDLLRKVKIPSPEKRIDEIIKAFKKLGSKYPLKIVGTGPEYNRLNKLCSDCEHIELMGYVDNNGLIELYSRCEAFVFAGLDEDFGIAPVEAMASGKPVVAIHEGGLRETVIENETGVFFHDAKANSIKNAIEACERIDWNAKTIIGHAHQYDVDVFRNRLTESVKAEWDNWNV